MPTISAWPRMYDSACDSRRLQVKVEVDGATIMQELEQALCKAAADVTDQCPREAVMQLLCNESMRAFLIHVSRLPVFDNEFSQAFSADLETLTNLKVLKYVYNLNLAQVVIALAALAKTLDSSISSQWASFAEVVLADKECASMTVRQIVEGNVKDKQQLMPYSRNADQLEMEDPHAVYPTSIYRQSYGHVWSNDSCAYIEGVMGTTITTTIKIQSSVLVPSNHELRNVYKPLGRAVAIVDKTVDAIYAGKLEDYFKAHGIGLHKLVYRGHEVDKDISSVEEMLLDLKKAGVSRNEPVLIVGGGVIADIGGFACALYHRNTPYVMLSTSIVSGIDAGPSPRTCCDGYGYKNLYGAYHPPILTLTDRSFFGSLHPGWLRHGIAEIVKMACVKDLSLFELLEKANVRLVTSKFGNDCPDDADFSKLCDTIVGKAMEGYVKSEYGNLWETHQCRPHAFGHTWSPGYEIAAGMLHGHAVATCMGYGAYLSFLEGWISEGEMQRIHKLISDLELSLYHPILEDYDVVWESQVKMTQKRGGNLCAPIPKGAIGNCGYLNNHSRERLEHTLEEYKAICSTYPRGGIGVEVHCHEVGLEEASTTGLTKQQKEAQQKAAVSSEHEHADSQSLMAEIARLKAELSSAQAQLEAQ